MNETDSSGAINQGSGLPSGMPQSPSGSRRVPVFVWIIIGAAAFIFLCTLLFLVLLAVPALHSSKKQANEFAAIRSVRSIQQAELMYSVTYPSRGYSCSLRTLGGDPGAGPPSAEAAQVLPNDLASGINSGYVFVIGNCNRVSLSDTERVTGYTITAVPQDVGKTGSRGFCSDESGTIKYDPVGGTNCTQPLELR